MSNFKNHGDKPIEFCGDQEGWIAVGSLTDDSPLSPCHPRVVLLGVGLGPAGKMHPSNIAAMLTVEQATDLTARLTDAMAVDRPAAPTPTPAPGLDLDARPLIGCDWHDGAEIDACGCPALDSPGAIAYRGLLVKDRAEIARLTAELAAARAEVNCGQDGPCAKAPGCARHWQERNRELADELAAARAVPANVTEALHDYLAMFNSGGETLEAGKTLRTAIARAISDATAARGTVGGLLATAPNLSDDEGQYVANRIGLTYELSTDAGRGRAIKAMRAAEEIIARGPLPKGG